jgi:hypothetical protein
MSSVVISGDTSGTVSLQAPAVAGSTVLTLPATSGTVITTTSGTASSATTATTSTNLAGGSNGTIPYQSASGTTQMLAVGTSGQLLQTNGAGAPSWVTPSTGAMSLVSTQTVSNAASLSWTGLTLDKYMIIFQKWTTSGGQDLYVQFGYGSTTWVTSGYNWVGVYTYASTGGGASVQNICSANASPNGFYPFYYINSAANPQNMNVMNFTGLQSSIAQVHTATAQSQYTNSSYWYYTSTSGANTIANPITAIRIIGASGTVSGIASLYAISS